VILGAVQLLVIPLLPHMGDIPGAFRKLSLNQMTAAIGFIKP